MKTQLALVTALVFLCSCASPRMHRVTIDGRAFDLRPGLYAAANPDWQRLSSFLDRADCTVTSTCTQGISVRRGRADWNFRLSTNELMHILGSIQKKDLGVVELSEYEHLDNLVRQNADVMRLVASQGFREVIVVTPLSKGLRLDRYIMSSEPVAPHEPPPRASVSDAPDDRKLDSLPAPAPGGGR